MIRRKRCPDEGRCAATSISETTCLVLLQFALMFPFTDGYRPMTAIFRADADGASTTAGAVATIMRRGVKGWPSRAVRLIIPQRRLGPDPASRPQLRNETFSIQRRLLEKRLL